jgi:hypothetical protein
MNTPQTYKKNEEAPNEKNIYTHTRKRAMQLQKASSNEMNIIRKRVKDSHNHSCMSTHVEIIIPRMTNFAVHNSSCNTKKRLARHETNFIYKKMEL